MSNPVAELVSHGYNAFIKKLQIPFVVRYWGKDFLVVPPTRENLVDVRRADKEHLSHLGAIQDLFFLYNWTKDLFDSQRMVFVVLRGLNAHLPKLSDIMIEEAAYVFDAEIPEIGEGTPIPALITLSNITSRTVSAIMMGEELCRDPKFLAAAQSYLGGNFLVGVIALKLPLGPLRDILCWPLWKFHQRRLTKAIAVVSPVVEERMKNRTLGIDDQSKIDGISCTLNLLDQFPLDKDGYSPALWRISSELLQNFWAAGQSSGGSVTQMLFQMLHEPQYLEPLRREAETAIAKHGFCQKILNELPLQDSFMRETNRLYSPFSIVSVRKVMGDKPFVFSNGLTLPPGSRIGLPAAATQLDPDMTENPEKFDGFRFVKLHKAGAIMEEGVNRWSASHSGVTNMIWGYGNHVCPGRFLAVRLVKIIFTKLLVEYDITWDRKPEDEQPARFSIEGLSAPNPYQKIVLKRKHCSPEKI